MEVSRIVFNMFMRTDVHAKSKKFSMLQHLAHNVQGCSRLFKDVQGHYPPGDHEKKLRFGSFTWQS
jgi:hypothetical protein